MKFILDILLNTYIILICTAIKPGSFLSYVGDKFKQTLSDFALTLACDLVLPPAGGTLSQLSDSGQTLSEDSGVDIAEAGGLAKDGSPRPSKSQQGRAEHAGAHVAPPGPQRAVRARR